MERLKDPAARSAGLLVRELEGELVIYDRDRHRVHCLNPTATELWRRCDGTTGVAELAAALEASCRVPADERVVRLGLRQLARARLLEDRARHLEPDARFTRRQLLRKLGRGAGVAALLPLVTTIVSPTPAAAQSLLSNNSSCTSSAQCRSGCCHVDNMKCVSIGPCLRY